MDGSWLLHVIVAASNIHKLVWLPRCEATNKMAFSRPKNSGAPVTGMSFLNILSELSNKFKTTHGDGVRERFVMIMRMHLSECRMIRLSDQRLDNA